MAPRKPQARSSVRDYRVAQGQGGGPENAPAGQPGPFSFVLEGDPVTKARPRVLKNGHVHTDRRTQEAERNLELVARTFGAKPHHGPVRLRLRFWHDGRRARDWDNLAKTVCDALNGVCWLDDSQIHDARVTVGIDRERPRTEVDVEAAPPVVERVMDAEAVRALFSEASKDF